MKAQKIGGGESLIRTTILWEKNKVKISYRSPKFRILKFINIAFIISFIAHK